jgi:hypothetical protein
MTSQVQENSIEAAQQDQEIEADPEKKLVPVEPTDEVQESESDADALKMHNTAIYVDYYN